MFSTLTIISIFAEIFAAGILLSGVAAFLRSGWLLRRLKDLFLAFFFFSLFVYVAAALTSQLMFNLERPLAELIAAQKTVSAAIIFCAFSLWLFTVEKFELKWGRFISLFLLLVTAFLTYRVFDSTLNLVYREGVVEPVVYYASWIPEKQFFALAWIVFGLCAFVTALASAGGKRKLAAYSGAAALCFLGSILCAYFYSGFGEAGYLLAAWGLILLSILLLLLAELIPPGAPEAMAPLKFLRTRILFKLMLIFILLIVILFEATTLATINISKGALSRYIQSGYLKSAQDIAEKLAAAPDQPVFNNLQTLVVSPRLAGSLAFIFDREGRLVAHPDKKRALQHEKVVANEAVSRALAGRQGADEFHDELGEVMVGAYVPVARFGWGVVVEEPIGSAYFELRRLETNSLIFVILGIIITALTGIFFARSIERPIKELTLGTEAVSRGELGYHIALSSSDEIGKLAVAFNQMTRELRDSQERLILSEKLASLGTMAAGMAHEIKNPLVSLRTFTQLLQQKWDDKEFREKFSSIIPHEIERINRIAESLLKFGRPMKPELSHVEVNSLLEEVLLLFESECKKAGVRVTRKLAQLPEISGDAGQLSQAFVNIIKNAIEAMQEKGGELTVKTDVGEVIKLGRINTRQGVKQGEEMVWGEQEELGRPIPVIFIEVTDTGEGISEDNLKSLFDPFFTTKMTGTGMGLPITLRIIEEHKGSIKVRSKPASGTTFIITLPQKL
ncbi:MAG: HAMP domain-containing protein [Candidatus Saganbacteria bacterium]|nr:HAMP domain-containing protein [Candidatus Saganbacteria bacterium]